MGKSKTEYHERPLSPEERQLYAQQVRYMQAIQPGIDALIAKGMSNINKTYDISNSLRSIFKNNKLIKEKAKGRFNEIVY